MIDESEDEESIPLARKEKEMEKTLKQRTAEERQSSQIMGQQADL